MTDSEAKLAAYREILDALNKAIERWPPALAPFIVIHLTRFLEARIAEDGPKPH